MDKVVQLIVSNNLEKVPGYQLCLYKTLDAFGETKLSFVSRLSSILFVIPEDGFLDKDLSNIKITLESKCEEIVIKTDNKDYFLLKLLNKFGKMSLVRKTKLVEKIKFMAA